MTSCSQYSGDQTEVTGLCRSCKPYYVRGSWHHPQKFYEYSEEGLASWYGPRFHDKKKASCERFDQHSMNAAHRTLPLPTIVRVTNLENGKSVVVLVDDRGPYTYAGRIIDLSMGAAKVIGCYQKGLARVRVESLVEDSKALSDYLHKHRMGKEHLKRTWQQIYEQEIKGKYLGTPQRIKEEPHLEPVVQKKPLKAKAAKITKVAAKSDQKPYVINVKESFSSKASADAFAKKLQSKIPTRVVSEKNANGKQSWRVQAGPFTDESKAPLIRKQIKQLTS
ncbi:MAG: septal ring lytic transglycosylase RlpA family protein [Pseudomonadota bacterium]